MGWRLGAGTVLAAAVVGGLAYGNYAYPVGDDIAKAAFREPDNLEQAVGHLANTSLLMGQEGVSVRCLPELFAPNGVKIGGFAPGAIKSLPRMIFIETDACQGLAEYAKLEDKDDASWEQVVSLISLAHEGDHVKYQEVQEPVTYCRGFQDMYEVAVTLGATKKEAKRAQKNVLPAYQSLPKEYQLADCYDEGPYDLNPGVKGVFPEEAPN